jgi:hypothetical protein
MRAWKYCDREVVHDTFTWQVRNAGRTTNRTTTRCDIHVYLENISWTENATTCLACLSCPPLQHPQGEPGLNFTGWTFSNPCGEVLLK